jgi:hypothetical protein
MAHLPFWMLGNMIYLSIARRLGERIVRQKLDAPKQGLELQSDVYSHLREPPSADFHLPLLDTWAQWLQTNLSQRERL